MSAPVARSGLARWAGRLALAATVAVAAAAALVATALVALRAEPGGWSVAVPVGLGVGERFVWQPTWRLSVPALVRVGTHPLGIRLLDGRRVETRVGTVAFRATPDGAGLVLACRPCRIDARALAPRPFALASAEATVHRAAFGGWHGTLLLASVGGDPIRATWSATLGARDGELAFAAADQPARDWVALFATAIPERAALRIEGTAGGTLRLALPSLRPTLAPRLAGLAVEGFGTEALLAARPDLPVCARRPAVTRATRAAPHGGWLPRAVVAAEDQRFFEHPGWDAAEMAAAWSHDGGTGAGGERRRGASTLSQQLARLLVAGDDPSAARKVRELLAAVELERTLGKARILSLYLAIAPWGEGTCGAEAAAQRFFGKPAARLEAVEAVWLASLLRQPDAALARATRGDGPDPRLVAIARAMRPLPVSGRVALAEEARAYLPPMAPARRAATIADAP